KKNGGPLKTSTYPIPITVPGTAKPNSVRNSKNFFPGMGFLANKNPCNIPIAAAKTALINDTMILVYNESQHVLLLKCSKVKVLFMPMIFTKAPSTTIINISKIKAENKVLIV